jgi:autotransporter passenger strand-loop-strand repeat protein
MAIPIDPASMAGPDETLTLNGVTFAVGVQQSFSSLTPILSLANTPGISIDGSGGVHISVNGMNLSGINFQGYNVIVEANNVTFNGDLFDSSSYFTLRQPSGFNGMTVEYSSFIGGKAPIENDDLIFSDGIANIHNNVLLYAGSDGIWLSGGTISNNYIGAGGYSPGAHADGITVAVTRGTPVNITSNYINWNTPPDAKVGANNAINFDADGGNIDGLHVNNNVLLGGGYTIAGGTVGTDTITNTSFTNNQIGDGFYGLVNLSGVKNGSPAPTWTGNTDFNNGKIVNADGSETGGGTPPAAPAITAFSPNTGGQDTTSHTLVISGTATDGTVSLLDGSTLIGTSAVTNGNWSVTENNAANGVHAFTATDTDTNGTSNPSAAFDVTVNVSAPPPPPPPPPNLVTNGGFETGNFTGWTIGSYQPDQTIITTNSHSGHDAAALGPAGADGSLSQTLATTPGQHYTLSFWLYNASTATDDFSVHWGGTTEKALVNEVAQGYTEYQFDVVATSATTLLQFNYRQDPTQWRLDDVSVTAGAPAWVSVGGTATGPTVDNEGSQTIEKGGTATGATVTSGGSQIVASGGTASNTTLSGGTLEVESGGSTGSAAITFTNAGGDLQLDASMRFHGLVAGFGSPSGVVEEIDLRDIAFGNKTSLSFQEAHNLLGGTLTVTDGAHTANLTLLGQYSAANFSLASDGHGGTLITDPVVTATASLATPQHA